MQNHHSNGAPSTHTENPSTPEQQQELTTLFRQLNKPTQQILLTLMKASIEGNVGLMRVCQQCLPKDQRHYFDAFIERIEAQEVQA